MQRAAIYVRISDRDAQFDKAASQEALCRTFAQRHGYDVVQVYVDDGISGYKFKGRPEFLRLLTDAGAGRFDVLVATFEDRLSRQPLEKLALMAACAQGGVLWHTIHEGLVDPASEEGELFAYFRGWLGRREQTHKIKRMQDRFAEQRAQGLPLWGVRPFGFEGNRIDHRLEEAAEVRWAYAHILGGGSIYSVIKAWNARGIRTTRGNIWSYPTVRQLLKRPRNAGLVEQHGEVIEGVRAAWKPIVSRQDWEEVTAVLGDPSRAGSINREPRWLCAGIARCGVCGAVMRSATGHDRRVSFPVYRCSSKSAPRPGDGRHHTAVKTVDLDSLVQNAVVSTFLLGPSEVLPTGQADLAEVRRVQTRLREVREGLAQINELVGTPGFSLARMRKRAAELHDEEEALQMQLDEHARVSAHAAMVMESRAALFEGRTVSFEQAARLKTELRQRFASLPLHQRRTLIRSLLTIEVHPGRTPDRIQIRHLMFPGLDEG